jgi:hypothetical protein
VYMTHLRLPYLPHLTLPYLSRYCKMTSRFSRMCIDILIKPPNKKIDHQLYVACYPSVLRSQCVWDQGISMQKLKKKPKYASSK